MAAIRTEVIDGVGLVTLAAPERRNAFDLAMCDEVVRALDDLEADAAVGAIVVTGEGTAFCAGADLSHLGSSHRDGLLAVYEGFLRFARSPLPTIAAVNGPAVGAGMNLALACDVRLAGESARFDTRFLQLGIHPGGGHTWMLQRIAGPQATAATVLFGEVLDGAEAARTGVAWRCVPDDHLVPTALAMAARAAAAPRELVERVKATIGDVATIASHPEAVERELGDQVWSVQQPAFAERLASMQRRISGNA
ncbi:MAG: enoyl-CoA hydratase [Acidimicrobiales bacterium]|nr:enoyl-CoA hydratase [Acidimicrobiales bacterium]MCB1039191.1 enoyl-CoA hydratase [Acidimicrobiales bacterium]